MKFVPAAIYFTLWNHHFRSFSSAFSTDTTANNGYTNWWMSSSNGGEGVTTYGKSVYLYGDSSDNGLDEVQVAVHWNILEDAGKIQLAVAAEAGSWLAFGIAESGGMPGSDIAVFSANDNTLTDYYATEYATPFKDVSQDWDLITSHVTEDGFIIWEAERMLNTEDNQDRVIVNDAPDGNELTFPPTKLIAAWGDQASVTAGQLSYHGSNRAKGDVRFFSTLDGNQLDAEVDIVSKLEAESDGSITLNANGYVIPSQETTYADFCFSRSDLIALGLPDGEDVHIIGFEPVLDKSKYLHHVTVRADKDPELLPQCSENFGPMIYVWGKEVGPLALPPEAGFKIGATGFNSLIVEYHYDNIDGDEGEIDSSGIRLYWTKNIRSYDVGVFEIGDPFVFLEDVEVGEGISRHSFACPSACSNVLFPNSITVFTEFLHMHAKGTYMTNSHYRNGVEIRKGIVNYFDFDQSGAYRVQQSAFTIQPGDSFKTECYYNSNDDTRFGPGSFDEMCIVYMLYYPIITGFIPSICGYDLFFNPFCSATHDSNLLESDDDIGRIFGKASAANPTLYPTSSPITEAQPTPVPIEEPSSPTLSPFATDVPTSNGAAANPTLYPTSSPISEAQPTPVPVEESINPDLPTSNGDAVRAYLLMYCVLVSVPMFLI